MRLDKLLTEAGLTRSQARDAVRRGRVTADGAVLSDPSAHVDDAARVLLDGRGVAAPAHKHLMLNKPAGCVCAREDARSPTVFSLLPPDLPIKDLNPIGRLDKDVTGILLFTTDGELLHRLISPRWHAQKTYLARVEGRLTQECVQRMAQGIAFKDFVSAPAQLRILAEDLGELTVAEGKYHQVKRMFQAVSCPVIALTRIKFASLALDAKLPEGCARALTREEARSLYEIARMEEK